MDMIRVLSVAGARPNFIKVGALHAAFSRVPEIHSRILHTGQHYDARMSDVFFRQLELPEPDVYLGIGSGSHAEQTARIMMAFEREVLKNRPDVVVVVGDVNSTLACALVCAKLGIPVAHVEAGLRSGDRTMPEEINRLITDAISDLLFVSEETGLYNLRQEGIAEEKVFFTGNVMIDSLVRFKEKAASTEAMEHLGLHPREYILMTMHRPANVDVPEHLALIAELLQRLATKHPVVFPLHPRTRERLKRSGLFDRLDTIKTLYLTEPVGYLEFLNLMMQAGVIVTDSGGVQEETTFLEIPCITLRDTTERSVTVEVGTNVLLPLDVDLVERTVITALTGQWKQGNIPPFWDGRAADRIAEILVRYMEAPLPGSALPWWRFPPGQTNSLIRS